MRSDESTEERNNDDEAEEEVAERDERQGRQGADEGSPVPFSASAAVAYEGPSAAKYGIVSDAGDPEAVRRAKKGAEKDLRPVGKVVDILEGSRHRNYCVGFVKQSNTDKLRFVPKQGSLPDMIVDKKSSMFSSFLISPTIFIFHYSSILPPGHVLSRPLLIIPGDRLAEQGVDNYELVAVKMLKWSPWCQNPLCELVHPLGKAGDILCYLPLSFFVSP